MDIVEQMRSFESDHEPDGWPAIQMKQVSALCDEVERLRAEIDAANAQEQEPKFYKEKGVLEIISAQEYKELISIGSIMPEEFEPLYARPIPAQQSPAVAVPASVDIGFVEDCLIAYKSGLYFDGAEGLRNKIDQQLSAIKQKSPRITEQDAREMALSAWRYWMNNCDRTVDNWIEDEGRDLTNKLNGVTNDTN